MSIYILKISNIKKYIILNVIMTYKLNSTLLKIIITIKFSKKYFINYFRGQNIVRHKIIQRKPRNYHEI